MGVGEGRCRPNIGKVPTTILLEETQSSLAEDLQMEKYLYCNLNPLLLIGTTSIVFRPMGSSIPTLPYPHDKHTQEIGRCWPLRVLLPEAFLPSIYDDEE